MAIRQVTRLSHGRISAGMPINRVAGCGGSVKYISVCSGIEAATVAWSPLGFDALAFSEIDKFPSAVLAHHYPDVPNLGDMTKFKEWPDYEPDILVGGTPCQSFSVAGLRKGLADPRGNLMLTYLAIAERYQPEWIVWENVPGVLSSNGGKDFAVFLDALEELGYICDIEILDAQFFGVAQRRRRVFVCGQHRDDLLRKKTGSSALTITQCLQEILQAILTVERSRSGVGREKLALPARSKDGATRRMKLLGLQGEGDCWPMLLENLAEALRRCQREQKLLDVPHGELEKAPTRDAQSTVFQTENLFTLTEQSLRHALDEALEVMKLFTTSTPTREITQTQIYTCSKTALLIAKLTLLLNHSSPPFWSAASSCLTSLKEYIDYARQTSSQIFAGVERVQPWSDFIEQAERTSESFLDIGIECFGEVFSVPDCLQRHSPPSREKREGVAPTISARTKGGGGLGTDFDCDGGLIYCDGKRLPAEIGSTLNAHYGDKWGLEDQHALGGAALFVPGSPISIQGSMIGRSDTAGPNGVGWSADGVGFTLTKTDVHAIAFNPVQAGMGLSDIATPIGASTGGGNQGAVAINIYGGNKRADRPNGGFYAKLNEPTSKTLDAATGLNPTCSQGGTAVISPVAFAQNTRDEVREMSVVGALASQPGMKQTSYIRNAMQVRRLTPRECERLQGFPDDYTLIHFTHGKPAADGPRYKALGNSMAVPVMRWIGERIQLVQQFNWRVAT